MGKLFVTLLVFIVTFLIACTPSTWVLEKERLSEVGGVKSYADQLQNSHTDFRGYRVFTISEGKKMVVVSTGESDHTLDLIEVDFSNNQTIVKVDEKEEPTDEANSYILIGIGKIKGELSVINQNSEAFKEYN